MPNWSDYPYDPKSYAGSFASQYQNKPQLPEDRAGFGTCDFHHCKLCKAPVANEPHGGFCGELNCSICEDFHKPITSRHYKTIITDDLTGDEQMARCNYACRKCYDPNCAIRNKSKKEVKMSNDSKSYEYQNLYEVITTYGGDRDSVIVKRSDVIAETEERARMQCKDDIESDWDLDYVEQDVQSIAEIRVKRKPRETKEVAK